MEAALVGVATGVMKPLLSKLSKLLEEEHSKLKGMRRDTRFIRDEMATVSAMLQMLADEEELDPRMRIWRDNVRELSYMEDCVYDFMGRVNHESGHSGVEFRVWAYLTNRQRYFMPVYRDASLLPYPSYIREVRYVLAQLGKMSDFLRPN